MKNNWSEAEAREVVARFARDLGEDVALRTYSSWLLGGEKSLVLHGGGNTSVKGAVTNVLGEAVPAVFVKATGRDMAKLDPADHVALDLSHLLKLRALGSLSDERMVNEFRTHLFDSSAPTPSIEALMHAFIPAKFIDHTHADAILALTNQPGGEKLVREALGEDVIVVGYVKAGFALAKAAADAFDAHPDARGMVLAKHGITTWGETARESYGSMIELVTRAEDFAGKRGWAPVRAAQRTPMETARARLVHVAPILRGLLARPKEGFDQDWEPLIVLPLIDEAALDFVDSERGKALALTPPLTPDHLIRTKVLPMWVDSPAYDEPEALREQLSKAVKSYEAEYQAYLGRHKMPAGLSAFDPLPRVVMMPGLGALCAGTDATAANVARDITAQSISVKSRIAGYEGLSEDDLFSMEYYSLQHAKLASQPNAPLAGKVAVVTGAAGAIGTGICRGLLAAGADVVFTDIPGPKADVSGHPCPETRFDQVYAELESEFAGRLTAAEMDVTDPSSVRRAVEHAIATWGGIDIAVHCAGVAHVCSLEEMEIQAFQRLERINVEGTLNLLSELARHFRLQGIGGDIILISTKNVFAPGARFGAYSATKAAAHQLARIASLELAEIGVRVNMVSPDAVFSEGARRSGLWAEIGPDRMRARGLDEKGLEEYYRSRNLLKSSVTAEHVANAVLYFATRQSPTTGATIPVDGGLPDATPR